MRIAATSHASFCFASLAWLFSLNISFQIVPSATATDLERIYERPHVILPEYESDDLYDNARDFTVLSNFIYIIAEMKKLTRAKPKTGFFTRGRPSKEIVQERKDVFATIEDVGDVVQILDEKPDLFAMDSDKEAKEAKKVVNNDRKEDDKFGRTADSKIVALHADEEDMDRSCVYAITKHEEQKRVVVIFRGTSNSGDWMTDAFTIIKRKENPVKSEDTERVPEKIGLHSGFANALLRDGEDPTGHVDKILKELKQVMEENPGYKLFVTGHSLGGALATLFGFYVAANEDPVYTKNAPVRVISVSSPRVGNKEFRKSFKYLEEMGKLRHARIYNARDKVAMVPFQGGNYAHVGLEIKLRRRGKPILLDYPRYEGWKMKSKSVSLWQQIVACGDLVRFHGCDLIRNRMAVSKEFLGETTLEKEYRKMWGIDN